MVLFVDFQVAIENKLGISRLEQVVEEISVAERLKELKREQKRLKKKAKRIEKCKYSNREVVNEEQLKPCESKENVEPLSQNGSFEDIDANGHEGSCEDDDDRDSVDTPCSCEDMHCTRRKWRESSWKVRRNGDCNYVGKTWSSEREIQNGSSCPGEKSIHICRRDEEEDVCSDCLSASSSNSNNGKTKKRKGKKKKKQQAQNNENKVSF